jgi:Ulp1 family protease
VIMTENDIRLLVHQDGDLNDLIIDGYLSLIVSKVTSEKKVLAAQTYVVSQIIQKKLKRFDTTWLHSEIIIRLINQNHHWYLIIIDNKNKLVVEFDSMPDHRIPRRQNIERLLGLFDIQHYFHHKSRLDFTNEWQYTIPTTDLNIKQHDLHSCGVHLLAYANAYIQNQQLPNINTQNVKLHRFHIAENILRSALPIKIDSPDSVSNSQMNTILNSHAISLGGRTHRTKPKDIEAHT